MGDFDFGSWDGTPSNRYSRAQKNQGFRPPTNKSPFPNPRGWLGGEVHQTGGMIMVRQWYTHPDIYTIHEERPGDKYEYEVAYGQDPGVSLNRYKWVDDRRDGKGAYEWDGVVENVSTNNDPKAKARAARKLMRKHSDKAR